MKTRFVNGLTLEDDSSGIDFGEIGSNILGKAGDAIIDTGKNWLDKQVGGGSTGSGNMEPVNNDTGSYIPEEPAVMTAPTASNTPSIVSTAKQISPLAWAAIAGIGTRLLTKSWLGAAAAGVGVYFLSDKWQK